MHSYILWLVYCSAMLNERIDIQMCCKFITNWHSILNQQESENKHNLTHTPLSYVFETSRDRLIYSGAVEGGEIRGLKWKYTAMLPFIQVFVTTIVM